MSDTVENVNAQAIESKQQNFIAKTPRLENSQDYAFLREQGLKYIEKLGHQLWTDYNIHDPGITILELLCYAITDLGYRTDYDIKDLLTIYKDGKAVNDSEFHTARDILTSSAVTFEDLRKLLIDIRGVRNVWIEPHTSIQYFLNKIGKQLQDKSDPDNAQKIAALNGLYDVYLEYDDFVVRKDAVKTSTVKTPKPLEGGSFIQPNGRGLLFDVNQGLTLDSVTVYPDNSGSLTVRIFDAKGRLLKEILAKVKKQIRQNRIKINCFLAAGKNYRIEVYESSAELGSLKLFRTTSPDFPYEMEKQITLTSGSFNGTQQKPFFFFYGWRVSYLPRLNNLQISYRDVIEQATERLHTHRNLCEDFTNICELLPEEIAVCTDIEIEAGADPDEILAEMFYQLEQHVSPVVNFYTIDELVDKGKTMEEIFEGPQLDHGFIDDQEFDEIQRRKEIRSSDLINIIMDIPHVIAVKNLSLLSFIDDEFRLHEEWRLPLATDQGRAPLFNPDKSKVVFYLNGIPDYASRVLSQALLQEKKAGDLRNKLQGHENDLAVPVGEFRDVSSYHLIQHEMPLTYRVGDITVAKSQTDLRKAQSKQLRSFMLFFEQLLVNYLAQLDHVKELFSWDESQDSSYFTHSFASTDLKNIDELYINFPTLENDLKQIIESEQTALDRRSRFLDHLVARFCESFTEYSLLMYKLDSEDGVNRVNQTKQNFLQNYAQLSQKRGQGYDYRDALLDEMANPAELSGYQQRIYGLLGIHDPVYRQLAGHLFQIIPVGDPADDRWRFVLLNESEEIIFESIDCQSKSAIQALLDYSMILGDESDNYQLDEGNSRFDLIRPCEDSDQNSVIGSTINEEVLSEVIDYFAQYGEAEGFHIIEHILLRKRFPDDPFMPVQLNDEGACDCTEVIDPYSFRLSVVLPAWSSRFKDMGFRQFVEDTLRREAPAHVFLKICWISHSQMVEFETIHSDWAESLSQLNACRSSCRGSAMSEDEYPLSGELDLPEIENNEFSQKLEDLISILHKLNTVYPLARLKGCDELVGDDPVLILDHSTLGTY
ncbi:MAG: hypothetical protein GY814_04180 [Gammaproteobacteria bacterium]|nr:hypothetical protein [Gammaproteobacteria bacterium]